MEPACGNCLYFRVKNGRAQCGHPFEKIVEANKHTKRKRESDMKS